MTCCLMVASMHSPQQLGIPRDQAQRGAEALLPSVLGGMGNNATKLDAHVNTLGGADLAFKRVGQRADAN